jgi:hypothetical protein
VEHLEYRIVSGELYHYGVLGMKWGVRRGNASRAFAKASAKKNKLDEKAVKKQLKSAKLAKKALKKETSAKNEKQYQKAREMQFEANKLNLKSAKLQKKAAKWERKMAKEFATVKISEISRDDIEKGKKYAYMLAR